MAKSDVTRLRGQLETLQQKYACHSKAYLRDSNIACTLRHTYTGTHTHTLPLACALNTRLHARVFLLLDRVDSVSSQLRAESDKYASLREKYQEASQNWLAERTVLTKQV